MFHKKMEIGVGGMKCEHCAKHVQEVLEKIENVSSVKVDLKKSSATLLYSKEVNLDQVKKALEEEEYEYLGVK